MYENLSELRDPIESSIEIAASWARDRITLSLVHAQIINGIREL
jgi:hypothetical protein